MTEVYRTAPATPGLLIICSFIHPFYSESSRHCLSQTIRAGKLEFWENVYPPPCVMCHMSHIMCHMSRVTCQV